MYDLLIPDAWFSWLFQVALVLAGLVPAMFVYGYLADQTLFEGRGRLISLRFGQLDIAIGSLLTAFFILVSVTGFHSATVATARPPAVPKPADMITGTILSSTIFLIVIGGILASLSARGIPWRDCFGPRKLGPGAVLGRAGSLIVLALPLITVTLTLAQVLLAGVGYVDHSPQEIVVFLEHNQSAAARWVVAIFAVVVAPMQEEFLFRGYLYGIMRRFAGPAVGTVLNAALFAAIHLHLPSFGGLFVLAVCLTLAYEWSGSLLVPMMMHAIFNSFTVINLLSGSPPDV